MPLHTMTQPPRSLRILTHLVHACYTNVDWVDHTVVWPLPPLQQRHWMDWVVLAVEMVVVGMVLVPFHCFYDWSIGWSLDEEVTG